MSNISDIGAPLPTDFGTSEKALPPIENYRGLPVVQVSFVAGASSTAESAFLTNYMNISIEQPSDGQISLLRPQADWATATTNLKAMFAKNVFYALHLAQFIKIKSEGNFIVILNPVTLQYDPLSGFTFGLFEENMPAADVEIFLSAYVHPNTKPSTKGDLVTTYGEGFAPIISVRVDPQFNPQVSGAIALTGDLDKFARNADGRGARAQLVDLLNAKRYSLATLPIAGRSKSSGAFEKGKYYRLEFDMDDLEEEGIPADVISPTVLAGQNYDPGSYYAYEFYNTYYKIILTALNVVDNRAVITAAQRNYWSFYDASGNTDFDAVMLQKTDRRKRRFLMKARQVELEYLEDRDQRWMDLVLTTNDFRTNFSALRDAEQQARDDYIDSKVKAGVGVLAAILGAAATVYSAKENNSYGVAGGGVMIGMGMGMVNSAMVEMEEVDVAFGTAFEAAYDTQKTYVFEIADGEKVNVRAKDYAGFKDQLKQRFEQRF